MLAMDDESITICLNFEPWQYPFFYQGVWFDRIESSVDGCRQLIQLPALFSPADEIIGYQQQEQELVAAAPISAGDDTSSLLWQLPADDLPSVDVFYGEKTVEPTIVDSNSSVRPQNEPKQPMAARLKLKPGQLELMRQTFSVVRNPSKAHLQELSRQIGLAFYKVCKWFALERRLTRKVNAKSRPEKMPVVLKTEQLARETETPKQLPKTVGTKKVTRKLSKKRPVKLRRSNRRKRPLRKRK